MRLKRTKIEEWLIAKLLFCCCLVTLLTTAGILYVLISESIGFFEHVSLKQFFLDTQWTPMFSQKHYGIWSLLAGTFLTTLVALSVAIPMGLIAAIYLSEYAAPNFRKAIKPMLEVLASVPSVVYGYFALLTVTPLLKMFIPSLSGFNALSAGIVMGIMIMPLISSLSEDALHAVPASLREAAYALGSTKLQVAFRVAFPAAFSGITAAIILAVSRAIGETMIVAIAAGQQATLTLNPLVPVETITAFIVQVSQGDAAYGSLEYQTIFVCGMTLFVMTFLLNILSFKLKRKFYEAA